MRLRRLDLVRYGKFTDFSLDLGPAEPGRADFHVVYGPNEAGKSTAFNGFLDLLYGIPERTPYGFLHGSALRVSALLEAGGTEHRWTRVKKRGADLLDGNDQPADPQSLATLLHGLDRDTFKTMLSLDDDTLEEGGEAILNSKGDVGRLLFSAAAGLGDLAALVDRLQADADAFHKPRARSGVLRDLKNRLDTLKKEQRAFDVEASEFEKRRKAREEAEARFKEADQALRERMKALSDLERLGAAFDDADRLGDFRDRLRPLEPFPLVPDAWKDEVRALVPILKEAETAEIHAREDVDRRNAEFSTFERDPDVLALEHRIAEVTDVEVRARAARSALPDLLEGLERAQASIAHLASRLGSHPGEDPRRFLLPDAAVETLTRLAARHGSLKATLDGACKEEAGSLETLRAAQADAEDAGSPDPEDGGLGALLERLRAQDPESAVRHAADALEKAQARLAPALASLAPWQGSADDLVKLHVPTPPQAMRWRDVVMTFRADRKALDDEIARCAGEQARLEAAIDAVTGAMPDLSDESASAVRDERDTAWADHKTALTAESAARFEQVMARYDQLTERRLADSQYLARLREQGIKQAEVKTELARLQGLRAALEARIEEAASTWRPALSAAGLPNDFDAEDLPAWLEKHRTAIDLASEVTAGQAALSRAKALMAEQDAQLRRALALTFAGEDQQDAAAAPKTDLPFAVLRDRAETVHRAQVTKMERARAAAEAVRKARLDLEARARAVKEAKAALSQWAVAWSDAAGGVWLGGLDPDVVAELLPSVRELRHVVDGADSLARQMAARKAEEERFAAQVHALTTDLKLQGEGDPHQAFKAVTDRFAAARETEGHVTKNREEHARLMGLIEDAKRRAADARDRVAEMTRHYPAEAGVRTLDDLQQAIDRSLEHRRLQEDVREVGRRLQTALETGSVEEAEAILAETDRTDLSARLQEARLAVEDAREDRDQRRDAQRDAVRAVEEVGGDDRAARLEAERRTVLLEIEDKAERALRLRLGLMLADRALQRYRERHRSAMLAHTAEAFRTMTDGAFEDLSTHPAERNKETLIAQRAGGGASVEVDNMSKGTRFQLYLALRLAGYKRFCETAGPLPFVADDIMETFDDARAAQAFRLLKGMAGLGQAIYFTHHDHLCTIARAVCGDEVRIHSLVGEP